MSVSIVALAPNDVPVQLNELVAVYLDMYPLPFSAGPGFASGLIERSTRDGFRMRVVRDDETGRLLGLAHGFTDPPRTAVARSDGGSIGRGGDGSLA